MPEYVKTIGPVDGGTFDDAGGIADVALVRQVANAPQFAPSANTKLLALFAANGLTAHAGGGQANALALTAQVNRITTVASAGDSVKLPASQAGLFVPVINAAAVNAMDVFPSSGDSINALGANTALSVAANVAVLFVCAVAGKWQALVSA